MKERDRIVFAKLLLKITFVMLCISVGLRLLGFNFFEEDMSNKLLIAISNFIDKYNLIIIINFLLLFGQAFIIFRLSCKNKNMKIYYVTSILVPLITLFFQHFIITGFFSDSPIGSTLYFVFSFLILIITPVIIDIKVKNEKKINKPFIVKSLILIWNRIKRPVLIFVIIFLYQLIVLFVRNITFVDKYTTIYNFLLNFDYILLLIATYYVFIKKENNLNVKTKLDFSLVELLNQRPSMAELKIMILEFKNKFMEFKEKDKIDKLVFILYVIFFIIEETLTLGLIIFIANLNNYVIECLFILTAFLISKKVFGAFHFKSFILCFFVSNTSFFILSKLTLNVTITFVVPIVFGMLLAYISSRFIKNTNTKPYRGMPEEDLEKICKNKKLNKIEKGILTDYYCNRDNLDKIAFKYSYSDRNIQRIKLKALQKIEA